MFFRALSGAGAKDTHRGGERSPATDNLSVLLCPFGGARRGNIGDVPPFVPRIPHVHPWQGHWELRVAPNIPIWSQLRRNNHKRCGGEGGLLVTVCDNCGAHFWPPLECIFPHRPSRRKGPSRVLSGKGATDNATCGERARCTHNSSCC